MRNRIKNRDWMGIENSNDYHQGRQVEWDREEKDRGCEPGWDRPQGRDDRQVVKVKGD